MSSSPTGCCDAHYTGLGWIFTMVFTGVSALTIELFRCKLYFNKEVLDLSSLKKDMFKEFFFIDWSGSRRYVCLFRICFLSFCFNLVFHRHNIRNCGTAAILLPHKTKPAPMINRNDCRVGRGRAPLFRQPLTKGCWAWLVTLTAYVAVKIGIEEYLMEKVLKILYKL